LLNGDPECYRIWAEEYFEVPVARWAVDEIYAHRALTEECVRTLNAGLALADLAEEASEIAYPTSV